ncbi:MAG: 4-hydroxy-tetrahydrodipicolinate synthase [Sporomusaceae bacterium]|nr:4-hydroxy-tetrahydrodipicolinate synthase [Sporomusaceae bacterium]
MNSFGRVLTAMVTPFHRDGSVNYQAAAALARHLIANGSDGLVVAGSTGEAATLDPEEKLHLFAAVADAVGDQATVIAGTGSNDTRASIALTRQVEKLGVHGVMLVGPYYNKPTQEGFYQHFKSIAETISLPAIIYNVPGRTASNILPETIARLATIPNIVAVKESSGNLDQVGEIIRTTPDSFLVYSGDDSLTLPILSIGGAGIISVAAHAVGVRMKQMVEAYLAGDTVRARQVHLELLPFFKAIFITTNPIPIKTIMRILGHDVGGFRLPLLEATDKELVLLQQVMVKLNIR